MKLLFIVPSLELGKDGVADYTFMLASSLQQQGIGCAALAWNDAHLPKPYSQHTLSNGGASLEVLRLSSSLPTQEKKQLGLQFVQAQSPTTISLQMVCFGFHPRGWLFGLGESLKMILPQHVPIEIMFHELWLGLARNHPLKEKLYGAIQKASILKLYALLKPTNVHVGNNVYYAKLKSLKWPVKYVPLPSNIRFEMATDFGWIHQETHIPPEKRAHHLVLLFFGSIHDGWDDASFFQKMTKLAPEKNITVVSVGSQGNGVGLWNKMQALATDTLRFVKLGFKSNNEISALLQFADAGICTTPMSLFGKSGTAMAMTEHGLPVIVTRNELRFSFPIEQIEDHYPHVYLWDELVSLQQLVRHTPTTNRLSNIASRFLSDMKKLSRT